MDIAYDPCALAGAVLAIGGFAVYGLWKDGRFKLVYLIDSLSGIAGGALLVPGLADIPTTDPCWERIVAGLLLALGVKFGIRQMVGKPMEQGKQD